MAILLDNQGRRIITVAGMRIGNAGEPCCGGCGGCLPCEFCVATPQGQECRRLTLTGVELCASEFITSDTIRDTRILHWFTGSAGANADGCFWTARARLYYDIGGYNWLDDFNFIQLRRAGDRYLLKIIHSLNGIYQEYFSGESLPNPSCDEQEIINEHADDSVCGDPEVIGVGYGGSALIEEAGCPPVRCVAIWHRYWNCHANPPAWSDSVLWRVELADDEADSGWVLINQCIAERRIPFGPVLDCAARQSPCPAPDHAAPAAPEFEAPDCCGLPERCGCRAVWRSEVVCPENDPPYWGTPVLDHWEYFENLVIDPGGGAGGQWERDTSNPCIAWLNGVLVVDVCGKLPDCIGLATPDPVPAPPLTHDLPIDPVACCNAQPCDEDCAECPETKSGTVSGFSGNCARYNGSWTFTRLNDECIYLSEALPDGTQIGLFCNDGMWIPFPVDQNGWNSTGRSNLNGCPPNGSYTLTGQPGLPPIECPGQTATLVLS